MKEIREQKEKKCEEYFYNVEKLTVDYLDCIIDYFEKYKLLLKYEDFNCDRKFVLQSVKNYEIISSLEPKNEEIKEHLNNIIEIYNKYGIKFIALSKDDM